MWQVNLDYLVSLLGLKTVVGMGIRLVRASADPHSRSSNHIHQSKVKYSLRMVGIQDLDGRIYK